MVLKIITQKPFIDAEKKQRNDIDEWTGKKIDKKRCIVIRPKRGGNANAQPPLS